MRTKLLNAIELQVKTLAEEGQPRTVINALRDFQEAIALKESPYWIIMKHLNFMRAYCADFAKEVDLAEMQTHLEDMDENQMRKFVEEIYGFKYTTMMGEKETDSIDDKWLRVAAS